MDSGEGLSSFDEVFASLRAEEESAIAAAETEAMDALMQEASADDILGGDDVNSVPPRRRQQQQQQQPPLQRRRPRPLYDSTLTGRPPQQQQSPSPPPQQQRMRPTSEAPVPPAKPPGEKDFLSTREWRSPGADGIQTATIGGGQLVTLMPTKVMVFIDGTWLYYQLFGRGRRCEITRRWGEGWWESYHVDYSRLPQLISDHLSAELMRTMPYAQRAVEVVRVLVYSSFRAEDPEIVSQRQRMFRAMQDLHFEVHLGEFTGGQEKCVDIALAVDMVHYSTVPNAFDIAVLVSGDRDFIPALVRTRQKGKRVCVTSMRNSASLDYEDPEANIKDFDVLWLDDHLDDLVAPIHPSLLNERPAMANYLRSVVLDFLAERSDAREGGIALDELSAHLQQIALGETSALRYIKHEFGGLASFIELFPEAMALEQPADGGAPLVTPTERGQQAPPTPPSAMTAEGAEAAAEHGVEEEELDAERDVVGSDAESAPTPLPADIALMTARQFLPDVASSSLPPKRRPATKQQAKSKTRPAPRPRGSQPATSAPEASPLPPSTDAPQSYDDRGVGAAGRSDGALIVDGSLLELLEADVFPAADAEGSRDQRGARPGLDAQGGALNLSTLAQLTVPQLKAELRARQLPVDGNKQTLQRRLREALGM